MIKVISLEEYNRRFPEDRLPAIDLLFRIYIGDSTNSAIYHDLIETIDQSQECYDGVISKFTNKLVKLSAISSGCKVALLARLGNPKYLPISECGQTALSCVLDALEGSDVIGVLDTAVDEKSTTNRQITYNGTMYSNWLQVLQQRRRELYATTDF